MVYALATIGKHGEREKITTILLPVLKDPISSVRISTIIALGILGSDDQDIKFSLSSLLKSESDIDVKEEAHQLYSRLF